MPSPEIGLLDSDAFVRAEPGDELRALIYRHAIGGSAINGQTENKSSYTSQDTGSLDMRQIVDPAPIVADLP